MPDNVTFQTTTLATPPGGTKVSSDESATSGQLQRVKLAYSADGVDTHVPADAGGLLVNLGTNNDVTVASLPLPTGAATSALQTQPGVDIGDVTVNNAAGASAVNIQDGGNVITVDGTVSVSEPVSVDDNAGSLTVDAPVGTPVNVKIGDGTDTAAVTSEGNLQTITPNRRFANSGTLDALDEAYTIATNGASFVTFYVLTSTLIGTLEFEGTIDGSTWLPAAGADPDSQEWQQSFDFVDPTQFMRVNIEAAPFESVRARILTYTSGAITLAATATNNPLPFTPQIVQNAGWAALDVNTELGTAAQISSENTATPFAPTVYGFGMVFDGSAWDRQPGTSADGTLVNLGANNDVTVTTLPALVAGSANIGDVDVLTVPSPLSTAGNGTAATAHRVTIASDSTGQVAVASIAAGDNNIGNVDVVSLPALVAGSANIGDVDVLTLPNVTLAAGTNTNEVVGDVAFDIGASGNPVLIGSSKETMADSAPANRAGTDGDVERLSTSDGALFVIPTGPQTFTLHATGVQTGAQIHAAAGAGLSCYITSISFSIGAATASSVKVLNNGGADFWGPHYLEAINGRGLHVTFPTPLKGTANTRIDVTTTGAATQTVDINGFIAPG